MPSGLRARSVVPGCFRGWDGPGVDELGRERILRTSDAEGPAMMVRFFKEDIQQKKQWQVGKQALAALLARLEHVSQDATNIPEAADRGFRDCAVHRGWHALWGLIY
jgi:hypothetical protein